MSEWLASPVGIGFGYAVPNGLPSIVTASTSKPLIDRMCAVITCAANDSAKSLPPYLAISPLLVRHVLWTHRAARPGRALLEESGTIPANLSLPFELATSSPVP